jgi:hypothetical protein
MEKHHLSARQITLFILLALLALLLSTTVLSAASDDGSVKDSFKKMGRAIGQAGKEVGRSAAAAGKAVGRESEKVWYRGVQVSKPALAKAREETRLGIQKSLDAMDRSIESLKAELGRLQTEEKGHGRAAPRGDDD